MLKELLDSYELVCLIFYTDLYNAASHCKCQFIALTRLNRMNARILMKQRFTRMMDQVCEIGKNALSVETFFLNQAVSWNGR